MKPITALGLLLLVAGPAAAETFTEDFEDYELLGLSPQKEPDQDWFNFIDNAEIAEISTGDPVIGGSQSLRVESEAGVSTGNKYVSFNLAVPATLSSTTFFIEGVTIADDGVGSNAYVALESSAPRRTLVEFYVFCTDSSNATGCELRVRYDQIDTTGQVLINASLGQSQFKIEVVPAWFDGEFQLFVDDVDDGVFPFMELPSNIGRLRIGQHSAATPLNIAFDDWTVEGATAGAPTVVEGDAANGIKNFLTDIRFTTEGSKLAFGVVLYIVLLAAVITPLLAIGLDNTLIPAVGFYATLAALWLIKMEIWPDWIGISLIILTSALISLGIRRWVLGIRDANRGPGLVAGSLGYFIITSAFLALSGYAGESIFLPVDDLGLDEDANDALPENETVRQSFVGAVVDCSIGIVSFGQLGDCDRDTRGKAVTWATDTIDSIARVTASIFAYGKAAVEYLFQLLTFQLPIPVVFNMMIVLPPASALATLAIQTIRGTG